jgi:hypothetical protein
MKNCQVCQKELESSKNFCGFCGAAQITIPEKQKEQDGLKYETKVKNRKNNNFRLNKKVVIFGASSVVVVGLLVSLILWLISPHAFSKDDVSSSFKVLSSAPYWGDQSVDTSSKVLLKKNFSGEYDVSLEKFESTTNSWTLVKKTTGVGPLFLISKTILPSTENYKYRLSIYRPGDANILYSSKVFEIRASVAHLPSVCPYKAFNELVGTDSGLTMDPGEIEGNSLSCTMHPTVAGDYFLDLTYTKVTPDAWEMLKNERYGTPSSLGLGETAAYTYTFSSELTGSYEKTVLNFHGIMIESDFYDEYLPLAIKAIEIK